MADTQLPWRQMIASERLHPNPDNPREDPGDLTGLAGSIRKNGLLQPVVARPAPDIGDGHYYIEAGYRRWMAMREWSSQIPAVIRPLQRGESPVRRNLITGLVENIHRRDLDPIEKARAFGRLRDELKLNQQQIAAETGLDSSTVSVSLALLELSDDTQERVRRGTLTVTEALRLVKRRRAAQRRKKGGPGRTGAVWEPDWFTAKHPLARKAAALCDAREHNSRRRIGARGQYPGACGQCWESVVREDERLVTAATAEAAAAWRALQDRKNPASSDVV